MSFLFKLIVFIGVTWGAIIVLTEMPNVGGLIVLAIWLSFLVGISKFFNWLEKRNKKETEKMIKQSAEKLGEAVGYIIGVLIARSLVNSAIDTLKKYNTKRNG